MSSKAGSADYTYEQVLHDQPRRGYQYPNRKDIGDQYRSAGGHEYRQPDGPDRQDPAAQGHGRPFPHHRGGGGPAQGPQRAPLPQPECDDGPLSLLFVVLAILTIQYLMDDTVKTSEDVEKNSASCRCGDPGGRHRRMLAKDDDDEPAVRGRYLTGKEERAGAGKHEYKSNHRGEPLLPLLHRRGHQPPPHQCQLSGGDIRRIMVVSSEPNEGKSFWPSICGNRWLPPESLPFSSTRTCASPSWWKTTGSRGRTARNSGASATTSLTTRSWKTVS